MYRVTIYNGTTSTVIHEPSTDPDDAHLYECSLVQGSSGEIDSLSFTITPNNPGYESLNPYSTFIEVVDLRSKGEAAVFSGRVLSVSPQMEESGLVYKNIVCEDRLGYLCDSIQPYTTMDTYTVREFLELLLNNHNAQVEDYKKMYVGTVSFETSSGNVTKSLNYQTTWEAITGKLLELGGEIQLYTLNGLLYIDYVTELGSMGDQTIEIAKNMRSLEQDKSPTDIITRLIPLGDYLEEQTGESDDRERLTIASVNGGKTYIDDDEAIAAYGIIAGTVVWEDVTIASNLLEKGQQWLKDQSVNETISLSAYDLYAAGIDPDVIERYNYYLTYNPLIGVNKWYRVAQKTINVIDPTDVSFTMGDQSTSLSSTVKRTGQDAADAAAAINANLSKTVTTLIAGNAIIQYLQAEVAEIKTLYVDKEYVNELVAADVEAAIINAGFLTADSAVITDLTAFAANIYVLLGGEGAFGELETVHLTADNVVIDTAVIVQAVAGTIMAELIDAEFINTDLIKVGSTDGTLWIDGSTILIYDEDGNPRIQIGLDELGDYNLALWDSDGNCMWNATGATEYGINDGVIRNDMVADDAAIAGSKLDIASICSIINENGDYVLNAGSVMIDNQSLDAWYVQVTEQIEGLEGLTGEGLVSIEPWFALWDSDETAPPDDEDLDPAICGQATCGNAVCGLVGETTTQSFSRIEFDFTEAFETITLVVDVSLDGYTPVSVDNFRLRNGSIKDCDIEATISGNIATIQLTDTAGEAWWDEISFVVTYTSISLWVNYDIPVEDGLYKWVKWKGYYEDGHTEWSIPYCLTDGYMRTTTGVLQTELEVVQGWISERVWYTEIMDDVDKLIETDVWSELNIWLNGIELEVGEMQSTFTDQYESLVVQVAGIYLDVDSITSRVESTEQQIGNLEYRIENLDLEGVSYFETYFYLWTSATEAPPDDDLREFSDTFDIGANETQTFPVKIDSGSTDLVSIGTQSGLTVAGFTAVSGQVNVTIENTHDYAYEGFTITVVVRYSQNWTLTDPQPGEGEYKWVRYLLYYEDGHTAWTTPYCVTEQYMRTQISEIVQTATSITERVSDVEMWIGDDYMKFQGLDTVITQYVTEESANIMLEVSNTYATTDYVNGVLKDLDLEGVTSVETYFCLSSSATEAPSEGATSKYFSTYVDIPANGTVKVIIDVTLEGSIPSQVTDIYFQDADIGIDVKVVDYGIDGNEVSITIENITNYRIRSDMAVTVAYDSEWVNYDIPATDGMYKWAKLLITYVGGYTEWTEPFLVTGDFATITYTDAQIKAVADDTSASIDIVARALQSAQDEWSVNIAEIYAYVDDEIASLTLSVTGNLGGSASIELSTNGKTLTTGSIDLSEVREAFANEKSSVTITAGLVQFATGTFAVYGGNFEITTDGAIYSGDSMGLNTLSIVNGELSMTDSSSNRQVKLSVGGSEWWYEGVCQGKIYAPGGIKGITMEIANELIIQNTGDNDDFIQFQNTYNDYSLEIGVYGDGNMGVRNPQMGIWLICMSKSEGIVLVGQDSRPTYIRGSEISLNNPTAVYGSLTVSSGVTMGYGSVNGNLGVTGEITCTGNIYMNGRLVATVDSSDERLKTSIQPLNTSSLDNLIPVSFKWKSGDDRTHYGYIAQEVQPYFPELVSEGMDGMLGLAYTELIPLLHLEIKQLKEQVKQLQEAQQ